MLSLLSSLLSALFSLLQLALFISIWLSVLLGLFLLTASLLEASFPRRPVLHFYGAFVVSASVLFELLSSLHRLPSSSSSCWGEGVRRALGWQCESEPLLASLWRLHPLAVCTRLIGDVIVLAAGMCGRSLGAFASSLVSQLSWLLSLPALVMVGGGGAVMVLSVCGYELSVCGGALRVSPFRPVHAVPAVDRRVDRERAVDRDDSTMRFIGACLRAGWTRVKRWRWRDTRRELPSNMGRTVERVRELYLRSAH